MSISDFSVIKPGFKWTIGEQNKPIVVAAMPQHLILRGYTEANCTYKLPLVGGCT